MKPQFIRHGEVILKPIASIPSEAKLEKEITSHVVAHSETGHHHVLETPQMPLSVYTWNDTTYVQVPEIAKLLHQKTGAHVHTPHEVAPSAYEVVIKKEFDYFAGKMREVRD